VEDAIRHNRELRRKLDENSSFEKFYLLNSLKRILNLENLIKEKKD
jgi:hypothetical protein